MMNCGGPVNIPNGAGTMDINNYGNIDYGTMSIADMTAVSSNTGYIRLSVTDSAESGVSPTSIVAMQERLGLTQKDINGTPKLPAVNTTTLGVGQANTTEMASAYGAFATGGTYRQATPIIKIVDKNGNTVGTDYSTGVEGEQVLSAETSYAVTQVLEGVIYKSIGTATAAALPSGQIAAGKTGTTNDWHDLWFVGYTPQLSCAVWTGDRDNEDTYYTDTWCQDIWRDLVSNCLEGQALEDFQTAPDPEYNSTYKGSYGSNSKDDEEEDEKSTEEEESQEQETNQPDEPATNPDEPTDQPTDPGTNPDQPTEPVDPEPEPEPDPDPNPPTEPTDPVDPGGGTGSEDSTG